MPNDYLTFLTPRVVWSPPDPARDRPVMGAIIGSQSTFIVETGASPHHANQFLTALAEIHAPNPRFATGNAFTAGDVFASVKSFAPGRVFAAVTHWHWDHVFGTATMGLPTIGHVETHRRVQAMARLDWRDHALDARVAAGEESAFVADHMKIEMANAERARLTIVPPDITFTDQIDIFLDDLAVQVIHVGGDHSPDSSVIFSPEERVAFLGDCLYSGQAAGASYYTLPRLIPLLDRLASLGADYFLLSHDPAPLTRAAFLREAGRLRRIGETVARIGPDRDAVLAQLRETDDSTDLCEDIDAFMRGLMPDVAD